MTDTVNPLDRCGAIAERLGCPIGHVYGRLVGRLAAKATDVVHAALDELGLDT